MQKLDDASKAKNGKSFLDSTPEQRHDLLVDLDKEQKAYMEQKKKDDPTHYFRMIKELTLWGYFTSEPGANKALQCMWLSPANTWVVSIIRKGKRPGPRVKRGFS